MTPSVYLGGLVLCGRLRLTTSNTMNGSPQQECDVEMAVGVVCGGIRDGKK